jgi:hypothetical protein
VRVDGEWSFAQTLRHLMATDAWLRVSLQAVPLDEAFHPWGLPHAEFAQDGFDDSGFTDPPSYDAVLAVRGERVAMVTAFLADLDDADLHGPAVHVWAPDVPRRVVSRCTRSWRRSGSTRATRCATWRSWRTAGLRELT